MNPIRLNSARLRKLVLAQSCALIAVSMATGQQTQPDPVRAAQDAQALAKYDTNKNGTLDASERAAMTADQANASTPSSGEGEVFLLTPFQVDASKDQGYYAENTLAGSRMKTNLSDLAASISVITKQQIEDTSSVDINDVFRYEINTEGSSTYTPGTPTFRADGPLDVISGGTQGNAVSSFTNATANRVRGLGVPSSATNYYPSISQVPFDTYNVQSLEISRGPNSMLFGMGSPAGIVNQSTAQAVLNRNTNTVSARFDQYGSYRGSFSLNRSLINDKLAMYGAILYDNRQFERKPSYDKTSRQYLALTFKPFSKTVIRAHVENYKNDNRRPNTLAPRDFVTQWNLAGKPIYDSQTRTVTRTATGQVSGPYVINSASPFANDVRAWIESRPNFNPALWNAARTTYNNVTIFGQVALTNSNSILYVPGMAQVTQSRTLMQIQDGKVQNWFQPLYGTRYRTAWGITGNPSANAPVQPDPESSIWANSTWAGVYNSDYYASSGWTNVANPNLGGYKYPGVTDRSIYDWKDVNINQMNFGEARNSQYNVDFEQEVFDNLFVSGGWFRQQFDEVTNYTVAQLNVATLFVDTNKYLPDGTPNPYVGKPYVNDFDPDQYNNATTDDHFRLMVAYTPDFTRRSGWLKWLGHHQLLGMWSRDESMSAAYRHRLNYLGAATPAGQFRFLPNPNNNANGTSTGWNYQGGGSLQRQFYLASPQDPQGVVTRSAGEWNAINHTGDIRVYDYATSSFQNINVTTGFNMFDAPGRSQRTVQSLSSGMTNYFWKDRLITTFGARQDKFKARGTTTGILTNDQGVVVSPALTNPQKFSNGILQDQTFLNRWGKWDRLTGSTKTMGGVLRPFRGWANIDSRADTGNLLWQFIRDFGVSYNQSDNFNAPPSAQVDAFGQPLPKPTGEGKDYGFQFSLFNNKLFARVTWFEATNQDERTSPGTLIGRLTGNMDTTLFRGWARTIAMINMGMDPRLTTFGQNLTTAEEDAIRAASQTIWQLPYTYYGDIGSIGATRDAEAKGMEGQLNYNPTRNWTMRLTFGKQTTIYSNVVKQFDPWLAVRRPVWQAARASTFLLPAYQSLATYTTAGGRQVDLTNFLSSYGFASEVALDEVNGNTSVQTYYNNVVQSQVSLATDLNGQAAPGQRKYRGSFLTNFNFDQGKFKGWGVGGSQRWEDKSVIGYYGRASGSNPAAPNVLDVSDTKRPIYDSEQWYTDLWVSYSRKIFNDRVRMKLQLNVENVFESGELRTTAVNYDGSPYAFRIIDPRAFRLTTTFEF
jgi:outer membrane receptor protein involved in Fe transport